MMVGCISFYIIPGNLAFLFYLYFRILLGNPTEFLIFPHLQIENIRSQNGVGFLAIF